MATYLNKNFGAANYAKFRPTYPEALYSYVLAYHNQNGRSPVQLTVDLACGTGQATRVLSEHSERVLAFDHSEAMVNEARKQVQLSNVSFDVGTDTEIGSRVDPASVDLLTVAEAAHYFHYPEFWEQSAKVLRPGGTLAIFSYWLFALPDYPEIAGMIEECGFAPDKCGPYWDDGVKKLIDDYKYLIDTIPEDKFTAIDYKVNNYDKFRPDEPFELVKHKMPVAGIIALVKTWSPYFNWKNNHPNDPDIADALMEDITKATGLKASDEVTVKWKTVYLLATRR